MANDNEKLDVPASDKPEVADRPSFLKDVKNGLVHALKTVWAVPEARGKIATLLVRGIVGLGLPAGVGTIATILIETMAK